jgi:hypothetical protein
MIIVVGGAVDGVEGREEDTEQALSGGSASGYDVNGGLGD